MACLLLAPFVQQMASYKTRITPIASNATNYRASESGLALPSLSSELAFVPFLPLKAAVYNGLYAKSSKPWQDLPIYCPTGHCVWESFDTLAVCNTCIDVTEKMTRYCANGKPNDETMAECGWSLPSGALLNHSDAVFSVTSEVKMTLLNDHLMASLMLSL